VVDTDLRILDTNAEAERIAQADDGIGTRRGRLTIVSGRAQRALDRRLRTLWQSPAAGDAEALSVARPSGLPDYRLDVVPARGRGFATILISDPVSPGRAPDPNRLASRLGLTAAEARVAGLAPLALTKAEIADRLGLSENTVRSHLRSARSKLGARNMVELALIVRTAG
jgi:DNA-binding CsgD family transcriptional regulator